VKTQWICIYPPTRLAIPPGT